MRIFGADSFRKFARRPSVHTGPIDDGRRPWRRERAFILDREIELKVLSLGVQIGAHSGVISDEARILLRASLQCLLRGFEGDEPIPFDHVQAFRVRSAELVDHGVRARLDANGIDHQRIALVMADGISKPGRRQLRGMSLVQAHVADFMIEDIQDRNAVLISLPFCQTMWKEY